jgi:hypothetical protein
MQAERVDPEVHSTYTRRGSRRMELTLDARNPTEHARGFIESYVMTPVAFEVYSRVGIDRDMGKGI